MEDSAKEIMMGEDTLSKVAPIPESHPGSMKLEQTLCMIKPDAMVHVEEILNILRREGFAILQSRRVHLNAEQTSQFYQDCYELPWFSESVAHLYSGPILAMVLSGPGAIAHLNYLIGPESWQERQARPGSLRFRFGTPGSDIKNGIHGSANEVDAYRELHFFFPDLILEPVLTSNFASYYLNENIHPILNTALTELVRARPVDPIMWLSEWLLTNNPNKPKDLANDPCKAL